MLLLALVGWLAFWIRDGSAHYKPYPHMCLLRAGINGVWRETHFLEFIIPTYLYSNIDHVAQALMTASTAAPAEPGHWPPTSQLLPLQPCPSSASCVSSSSSMAGSGGGEMPGPQLCRQQQVVTGPQKQDISQHFGNAAALPAAVQTDIFLRYFAGCTNLAISEGAAVQIGVERSGSSLRSCIILPSRIGPWTDGSLKSCLPSLAGEGGHSGFGVGYT